MAASGDVLKQNYAEWTGTMLDELRRLEGLETDKGSPQQRAQAAALIRDAAEGFSAAWVSYRAAAHRLKGSFERAPTFPVAMALRAASNLRFGKKTHVGLSASTFAAFATALQRAIPEAADDYLGVTRREQEEAVASRLYGTQTERLKALAEERESREAKLAERRRRAAEAKAEREKGGIVPPENKSRMARMPEKRPSVDVHLYETARRKADILDTFARRFFARWAMDAKDCPSLGNKRMPCLTRSRKASRVCQEDVARQISENREVGLFWPMGWGKTHGGVLAAECALQSMLSKRRAVKDEVVVLTKKSLIANFRDGLVGRACSANGQGDPGYGQSSAWVDDHYTFLSFECALKHPERAVNAARDAVLVIDEVHILRTLEAELGKMVPGRKPKVAIDMARVAAKLVVLTGTPLVNYVRDLYNLALMFSTGSAEDEAAFRKAFPRPQMMDAPNYSEAQLAALDAAFGCKISYIPPDAPRKDFPTSTETAVLLQMGPKLLGVYEALDAVHLSGGDLTKLSTSANYQKLLSEASEFEGKSWARLIDEARKTEGKTEKKRKRKRADDEDEGEGENRGGFLSDLRQAVNGINAILPEVRSPKIDFVLQLAKCARASRLTMIVYSAFVNEAGMDGVAKALETAGFQKADLVARPTTLTGAEAKRARKSDEKKPAARRVPQGTKAAERKTLKDCFMRGRGGSKEDEKADCGDRKIGYASNANSRGGVYARIEGETSDEQRQFIQDAFNARQITVLLISEAGGTGIDLHGASYHVNLEPPWNAATRDQASARGVRLNSHRRRPGISYPRGFRAHVDIFDLYLVKPADLAPPAPPPPAAAAPAAPPKGIQDRMEEDALRGRPGAPQRVMVVKGDIEEDDCDLFANEAPPPPVICARPELPACIRADLPPCPAGAAAPGRRSSRSRSRSKTPVPPGAAAERKSRSRSQSSRPLDAAAAAVVAVAMQPRTSPPRAPSPPRPVATASALVPAVRSRSRSRSRSSRSTGEKRSSPPLRRSLRVSVKPQSPRRSTRLKGAAATGRRRGGGRSLGRLPQARAQPMIPFVPIPISVPF